jgi:hypothetical protein
VPTTSSDATERLARAIADLITDAARPAAIAAPKSWRERLWTCDPNVRLGVVELAEALGRSKAFVYRLTRQRAITFRKLDGVLTFRAGDVRIWLPKRETLTPSAR